jgi:IS30 family transposase
MKLHKSSGKLNIEERPILANQRERIGDWERDCMYAAKRQQLLVCTDRKSRFTKIARVREQSVTAIAKLTNQLLRETKKKAHTVTNDNGPEFRYPDMIKAKVYYCHPRKPQQRGTVENTIGLIRQHIKRKTNLDTLSDADIKDIEDQLNFRPRKCLDYLTPYEVFYDRTVALAS